MDLVAVYGAVLSTGIVVVQVGRFFYSKWSQKCEKEKVYISLNHMVRNDPKTNEKTDIAFILFANLGKSTIVLKEVKYIQKSSTGSPGWYQEPEATHGIMKRVLPAVLKAGDVVELPLFYMAFFTHDFERMVLRDIEDKEYVVPHYEVQNLKQKAKKAQG